MKRDVTALTFHDLYGSSVCMVFDESGNAYDCFDYTPEALEAKARDLRAQLVTMEPSPFAELSRGN